MTENKAETQAEAEDRDTTVVANDLTKAELQKVAESEGLSKEGTKAEIADRINKARKEPNEIVKSDPRFDHAPGKSFEAVQERAAAHARGENQEDENARPTFPGQVYTVKNETSLIEVAATLGLPDHAPLLLQNGRYNSITAVEKGDKIALPDEYDFSGVKGVKTEK